MKFNLINTRVLTEDIESMKKYYPNIPDEKFMYYIKLDPTYKDGSKNAGNYGKWILGLANKGEIENIGHLTDVLRRFEDSKNNLKNKDIMKYKSVDDVENMLNDDDSYKDLSHRQEVRQRQKDRKNADLGKEAKLVYEDSDWEVWVPESYAASCKLGQGAKWCTASTEDDYYYNFYKNQYGGEYYINISKKDPSVKFQFHFPSGQFMDVKDAPINLAKFMEKYPALKDFYYENEVKNLFHDIDLEAGTAIVDISKSDVAQAVEDGSKSRNRRDYLTSKFIESILYGEGWEYFQSDYGAWENSDKRSFLKYDFDLDKWYTKVKKVYINNNGTSDEDEYEDLDKAEQVEYFIDNDSDIYDAFSRAYNDASDNGAMYEAEKDIIDGILASLPSYVDKEHSDIWNAGSEYSKIAINTNKIKDEWAEAFSSEYGYDENAFDGITNMLLDSIRNNCRVSEPYYGWYGFDNDAFYDTLYDELYQYINDENESFSYSGDVITETVKHNNNRRFLLTEDIDDMRKYYPNIPEDKFMYYIELDPTYKKGSKNAGTYAKWILGMANKGNIENIGHLTDVLKRFDDSKKNLVNKDIMKFKSVSEVEDMLNDDSSYKDLSHRQEVRQRQKDRRDADLEKDADIVYKDSKWTVYVPNTYAASCKLGQGTTWCTASTESDYYYNMYKDEYGGDYYIVINNSNPSEKYQFHIESGQYMDKDDNEIDIQDFLIKNDGLYSFIGNIYSFNEEDPIPFAPYDVWKEFAENDYTYVYEGYGVYDGLKPYVKKVIIPDSVTSIGEYAFWGCTSLTVHTKNEYVINYCKEHGIPVEITESLNEVYPNKGESKKDFISRFMSATKNEYPDRKQRYAVALSYWDRKDKKNESITESTTPEDAVNEIEKFLLSLHFDDIIKTGNKDWIEKRFGKYEVIVDWYMSHFGSAWPSMPVVGIQIDSDDKPNGYLGTGDIETEDEYIRTVNRLVSRMRKDLKK